MKPPLYYLKGNNKLFNFRKYLKKLIIIKFCLFLSDSNIDLSLEKLSSTSLRLVNSLL